MSPPAKWTWGVWILEKKTGLCLFQQRVKHLNVDSDIFTGFLLANLQLGEEVSQQKISCIEFSELKIAFKITSLVVIAVAVDNKTSKKDFMCFLDLLAHEFHHQFEAELKDWKGNCQQFQKFEPNVEKLLRRKELEFLVLKKLALSK